MNKQTPGYLKLHVEESTADGSVPLRCASYIDRLCCTFPAATGWSLGYENGVLPAAAGSSWSTPVAANSNPSSGRLSIASPVDSDTPSSSTPEDASALAEVLADLLDELRHAHQEIRRREADLATAIPVVSHPDEADRLAERLEAVLRGGGQAVGCQAAALYLLDEGTSQLKLRAHWGLPPDRFLIPARPLQDAVADLEALTGHAVVLEDTRRLPHWRVHEPFPAAVCVPVASPTMLLGTLWVFCERARDFTDQETNLIEITAGRLASDLERHVLLRERVSVKNMRDQLTSLTRWQQDRLPQFPPLVAGWDVAGGNEQADWSLGDFYNWFVLEDGRLSLAAGGALSQGLPAALTSAVAQSLVQSHYGRLRNPDELLAEIQQCLWATSAGDQLASMFYGIIQPDTGEIQFATAGFAQAYILRPHGWEVVDRESPPLGGTPDHTYPVQRQTILDGDVLLVISDAQLKQDGPRGARRDPNAVAETLLRHTHLGARDLAEMAIGLMHPAPRLESALKQTVLVARRKDRPQDSSP